MLKLSFLDIVGLCFIELNRNSFKKIDEISIEYMKYFTELLKLNSELLNINFEVIESKLDFYNLRFSSSFFYLYENNIEYVVKIKEGITLDMIIDKYKNIYTDDLNILLEKISFYNSFEYTRAK